MDAPPKISGPGRPPASGGPARQLVVFLHGWGSDGNDLIALAADWARRLPNARFVAPHAPDPCEQNPAGRQWFSLTDRDPRAVGQGAARAAGIIDRFLDDELARLGLSDARLALVGFSQGTMMALHVALRRARACAAVVGYSGALVGGETLAAELRSRPPVFLAHGDADERIPFESLSAAVAELGRLDVPVRWHVARGVGHGIDAESLALGGDFLADALGG